jgi:hypothetical protein
MAAAASWNRSGFTSVIGAMPTTVLGLTCRLEEYNTWDQLVGPVD